MDAWMQSGAASNLQSVDIDTCDSLTDAALTDFLNRHGGQLIGLSLGGHHKLVEHFWITNVPKMKQMK